MRINKFLARATGMSRRAADTVIADGRVTVNGHEPTPGQDVTEADRILLDGAPITPPVKSTTIMLNKPVGYVVSRSGQGSRTIYNLIPQEYHSLKPIGRLDKDSSGLVLLTDDGELANNLTHPSHQKRKIYYVTLDKNLEPLHHQVISQYGVQLVDGESKLGLERRTEGDSRNWIVTMSEGRNRQIRRTFSALGYTVTDLHRTQFGEFSLGNLPSGQTLKLS